MSALVLCLSLCAATTPTNASKHEAPAPPRGLFLDADQPPPSTWDKMQQGQGEGVATESADSGLSLTGQLVRTFIALAAVIGLLYFLAKVGRGQWIYALAGQTAGRSIKILERVSLDAKHNLFVVEVEGGGRLLLGSSDGSLQVLRELTTPVAKTFEKVVNPSSEDTHDE